MSILLAALLLQQGESQVPDKWTIQPDTWTFVADSETGTNYFIKQKDRAEGPGMHDVWIKGDMSKDKSSHFRSNMALVRFDCDTNRMAVLESVSYLPNGQTTNSPFRGDAILNPVVPDSTGEALTKAVCIG